MQPVQKSKTSLLPSQVEGNYAMNSLLSAAANESRAEKMAGIAATLRRFSSSESFHSGNSIMSDHSIGNYEQNNFIDERRAIRLKRKAELARISREKKKLCGNYLESRVEQLENRVAIFESEIGLPRAGVTVFLDSNDSIIELFPNLISLLPKMTKLPFYIIQNGKHVSLDDILSLLPKSVGSENSAFQSVPQAVDPSAIWDSFINLLNEDPQKRKFLNQIVNSK